MHCSDWINSAPHTRHTFGKKDVKLQATDHSISSGSSSSFIFCIHAKISFMENPLPNAYLISFPFISYADCPFTVFLFASSRGNSDALSDVSENREKASSIIYLVSASVSGIT